MKVVNVAAGVILQNQCVLLAQRALHGSHGGMWEFPGGKIEQGESAEEALHRELKEEIGIVPRDIQSFTFKEHCYGNWIIHLHGLLVKEFHGTPCILESQLQLRWVPIHELTRYPFPRANLSIIASLIANVSIVSEPATVL